jgi:hypothetical protein
VDAQIRGLFGEFGLVVPKGVARLRRELPSILEDAENGFPALARGARRLARAGFSRPLELTSVFHRHWAALILRRRFVAETWRVAVVPQLDLIFWQYLPPVSVCTSDLPMCADVQIKFRRASNILSREIQMTGTDAVLPARTPYEPVARYL